MVSRHIVIVLLVLLTSNGCGAPQDKGDAKPAGGSATRGTPVGETDSRPKGTLPPDHIQRRVRASFSMFRKCYEGGLARNAKLEGRASIKFLIEPDGKVITAGDGGSTLPDPEVISCLVARFRELSFDPPAGGVVRVLYPIDFRPGE